MAETFDPDDRGTRRIEELEPEVRLPSVTESEFATILAALRQYQRDGWLDGDLRGCYFGPDDTPLQGTEIDDLCEHLNLH